MTEGIDFSVRIANYKCFGSIAQGFERVAPINLIVGRNNVGKSALLDVIEHAVCADAKEIPNEPWHQRGDTPLQLVFRKPLDEGDLRSVFRENRHGGTIPGPLAAIARTYRPLRHAPGHQRRRTLLAKTAGFANLIATAVMPNQPLQPIGRGRLVDARLARRLDVALLDQLVEDRLPEATMYT
jgi:hypothetical protein